MCLMASANHLLIVFLGVEMASVPSYALAGMLKGRRQSSEAALKYSVYGAGTAGVMLYGISLLAGALGTCHLPTMAHQLAKSYRHEHVRRADRLVLVLGGLMMIGRAGVQAVGRSVPLLVSRRVRRGERRSQRLPVRRLEGRRAGAVDSSGHWLYAHADGEPADSAPAAAQQAAVMLTIAYRAVDRMTRRSIAAVGRGDEPRMLTAT